MIKGLHHNAYRCRDSEETRAWYEDFLGLRLVSAFEIDKGNGLHTFFEMDDGSCLAFFEVPGRPFDFKPQNDLDLHIALGVENDVFDRMLAKGRAEGIEVRGPVDHGFVRSIYFRDPNGLLLEYCATTREFDDADKEMKHHDQPGVMVADLEERSFGHAFDL